MKRFIFTAILLFAVVFTTGCTAAEIGGRAIIQACAVDYSDGEYIVSALMFSSSAGSSEIDVSDENVIKVTGSGATFAEAVDNISLADGKEIFLSESKLLIIGGGFAERDFAPVLETLSREMRCSLNMLVCCSDDAELLTDMHFTEGITAAEKPVAMIENANNTGNAPKTYLLDLLNDAAAGRTTLIPMFEYAENGFGMTEDENGATAVICGSREFSEGMLGKKLDITETKGAMLLSGDSDKVYVTFNHGNGEISCEAYCVRVKRLSSGDISVSAKLRRKNGESLSDELRDAAMRELKYIIFSAM